MAFRRASDCWRNDWAGSTVVTPVVPAETPSIWRKHKERARRMTLPKRRSPPRRAAVVCVFRMRKICGAAIFAARQDVKRSTSNRLLTPILYVLFHNSGTIIACSNVFYLSRRKRRSGLRERRGRRRPTSFSLIKTHTTSSTRRCRSSSLSHHLSLPSACTLMDPLPGRRSRS
jgi:hypothetical protein